MEKVPGAKSGMPINQGPGQEDVLNLHRPCFSQPPLGKGQSRVQRGLPPNGEVGMKQLLKNLRRGHENLPGFKRRKEELPRLGTKGMGPPHRIHENVGVDEDHGSGIPCPLDVSMISL